VKRRVIIFLLIIGAGIFLANYFNEDDIPESNGMITYQIERKQVDFYVDGSKVFYKYLYEGSLLGDLPTPEVKEHMTFQGWFSSSNIEYTRNSIIRGDISLYAKYTADYAAITNEVSTNIIRSMVKINVLSYDTGLFGIKTRTQSSSGSGVIFHEQNDNYYVLTNNHVAIDDSFEKHEYEIVDYLGNTYKARLHSNSNKSEYDLAVLYFEKDDSELRVIDFSRSNPNKNTEIIAIGEPNGQSNTITFGSVSGYRKINFSEPIPESQVTFNVLSHSAPTSNGSSGGALIDFNFRLVGINFAVSSTTDDFSSRSYAIPIEKIREYLDLYVYS
jgi:serine protease Do